LAVTTLKLKLKGLAAGDAMAQFVARSNTGRWSGEQNAIADSSDGRWS
jgi:hypothetical protein